MNTKKVIAYWKNTAAEDWHIANSLYRLKHYSACLFYCHLTLEKLLKGLIVLQTDNHAPYIHDLITLANKAHLGLTRIQKNNLETISTFNIAGRYDSVKLDFHKRCTPSYTKKYLAITKNFYLWLEKKYHHQLNEL